MAGTLPVGLESQGDVGVAPTRSGVGVTDGAAKAERVLARSNDLIDDADLAPPYPRRPRCARAQRPALPRPAGGASSATSASLRRCRIRTAAIGPITATSAPGQAKTRVAPRERAFIAMYAPP